MTNSKMVAFDLGPPKAGANLLVLAEQNGELPTVEGEVIA